MDHKHIDRAYKSQGLTVRTCLLLVLLALTAVAGQAQTQDYSPRAERLKGHVYYLASDELRGRGSGSADAYKAAQYVAEQFAQIGLTPLFGQYLVPFEGGSDYANSSMGENLGSMVDQMMSTAIGNRRFYNVAAVIEGSDPELKRQYIVLGAHYDHLGAPGGVIHNGADDNASGTACLIEVARQLMEHRDELKRSVVICAFDGEELGLYGSIALAKRLADRDVRLMMSLDMVGWYRQSGYLKLEGTSTLEGAHALLQELAREKELNVRCKGVETSFLTATDTEPFAKQGCPTLAVTTGLKSPYHKPEDDAELIDYEGLDRISDYISDFTLRLASQPQLESTGRRAFKHGGKREPFEMGLALGLNSMSLSFPQSHLFTSSRLGWQGGITLRYNLTRNLSLRAAALYEQERTYLPAISVDGTSEFRLDASTGIRVSSLTVPVGLYCGNTFSLGAGLYLGLPLSHTMQPDLEPSKHNGGFFWSIGVGLGRFDCQFACHFALSNYLASATAPTIKSTTTLFTINYYLW